MAKPGGDLSGELPGNSVVEIGPGSFETTDVLGGGSCIQDVTVNVGQFAAQLPLSKVCPLLPMLGYVLMGLSFFVAARIVAGA
ncbi:virulence factor TspB C-terminal domain-related protein [Sphingomonas sp. NCPPB 2930]